jgi:MSHA biogenesis protein MshQ
MAGSGGAAMDGSVPCSPCLLLYWKFDEAAGAAVALDSSGNGFDGTFLGTNPTTLVPPVTFVDPSSRAFVTAKQQAVQIATAPAMLKPANNLTISVWYRSPATDTLGGEVVSLGENYALVLRPARTGTIELLKVQPSGTRWTVCSASPAGYLGSAWHHLAGVISPAGMKIYFDGAQAGTSPDGADIVYPLGASFFVGREGNSATGTDYNGYIDEVRIYGRALSAAEIAALAAGMN